MFPPVTGAKFLFRFQLDYLFVLFSWSVSNMCVCRINFCELLGYIMMSWWCVLFSKLVYILSVDLFFTHLFPICRKRRYVSHNCNHLIFFFLKEDILVYHYLSLNGTYDAEESVFSNILIHLCWSASTASRYVDTDICGVAMLILGGAIKSQIHFRFIWIPICWYNLILSQ